MTTINTRPTVTLQQAAEIIAATPSNRYLLQGEPGIGKSSLIQIIKEQLEKATGLEYNTAYIDTPTLDLGDIAMPVVNHDTKSTSYYPNARFRLHEDKPVIIMLDEFTKGAEPVKNMLHPLLEVRNPRLGDLPINQNSIVFMTGNLSSDLVGDNMKAHTMNRITPLLVSKPDSDSWIDWAMNQGSIAPEIIAWVKDFPQVLASYLDGGQENNPYIFNPKAYRNAFVSPRSLERASPIVKARKAIGYDAAMAALSGTIGEAGARDLTAYLTMSDKLPSWEDVLHNPTTCEVPDNSGAIAIMVFGAVLKADKTNFKNLMTYVKRLSMEWQAVFCINMAKIPAKQVIMFNDKEFMKWYKENEDICQMATWRKL